jgi:hypothetical protein
MSFIQCQNVVHSCERRSRVPQASRAEVTTLAQAVLRFLGDYEIV